MGFKKGNPGGPGSQVPKYTDALATEICKRLADGESLRSICRDKHMPDESAVRTWALDNPVFGPQYVRARELGYLRLADELLEIADNTHLGRERKIKDDGSEEVTEGDMLGHRTLRLNTRKWLLSKMLPKIYGDKVAVTPGEGLAGGSVEIKWLPPDKS